MLHGVMAQLLPVVAQASDNGGSGGGGAGGLFGLIFGILGIVALWKVFTKAGEPGWKSIIPFYNIYTLLKIVGRPGWWLVLLFIPIVNIVILVLMSIDLAKSFGKGVGFAIGLILLNTIFLLILAFGDATYVGPAARQDLSPARV